MKENIFESKQKETTPKNLLRAVESSTLPLIRDTKVNGREHLSEIPADKKVIILTTHVSDADVPLVIKALGNDFNIVVSDQSTNHSFKDPIAKAGILYAGEENFIPIDYKKSKEGKEARFNPENFSPMVSALEGGKAVLVAAHNPSHDGKLPKGGIGGIYLAELSGAIILPVAVNVKFPEETSDSGGFLNKTLNRKDADITIGSPISLGAIEGIEDLKLLMDKRSNGSHLTEEELNRFKTLTKSLKDKSEYIMKILASMMPKEKRGVYSETLK